jgi:hypothetical protein
MFLRYCCLKWAQCPSIGWKLNGYGALLEWYWQGKSEVLGRKPAPLPLCPLHIPHELSWRWSNVSAVINQLLTDWAMAWPVLSQLGYEEGVRGVEVLRHTFLTLTLDGALMSGGLRNSVCQVVKFYTYFFFLRRYSGILQMYIGRAVA